MSQYQGHFPYNLVFINTSAPLSIGVYYCGQPNPDGTLGVNYVGRAIGSNVSIRSRLQDHHRDDYWPEVTHFGFVEFSSEGEAAQFEQQEIARLNPKYNQRVG